MNVIDFFDRGATLAPDRPCFVANEQTYSYQEIRELTLRAANGLHAEGFFKGFHGAVLSINDPIAFTCVLSVLRAGGAWVPINPKNAVEENIYLLDFLDCDVLFYHSYFAPQVAEIRQRVPGIRGYICIDKSETEAPSFAAWVDQQPAAEIDQPVDPEALAVLAGTGGTTGKPKGVMLTNRNLETFVAATLASLSFDESPVYLAATPTTHAAGALIFPILALGGTTIVHSAVDPQQLLEAIPKHRVSMLFLPPTVIYVLLGLPYVRDFDYASLKYFFYGAAPMSADKLKQSLEIFGPVMTQFFGQTEAPMMISFMSPAEHFDGDSFASVQRLKSCGRPTPFVRMAIMDDEGKMLDPGEKGEIVVQGDLVMQGYYKNPAATAETLAYGWLHTGDVGYRDQDGYFYIVDRKKDMIISGGFNVYPSEIEQVVWSHPAVQDCAVIGVPDEKWGEAVKAVVELKPGADVAAEELIALCKEQLGSVKAPKSVDFIDSLPRSAVGKVLKKEIRQQYWEGRDRAI